MVLWSNEFCKYEAQTLVERNIIVHPVNKNLELVLYP
jgi:hypothetical protein